MAVPGLESYALMAMEMGARFLLAKTDETV